MWSWTRYSLGLAVLWVVSAVMVIWGHSAIKTIGTVAMAFVTPYLFAILISVLVMNRNSVLLWSVIYAIGMTVVVLIVRGSRIGIPEALVAGILGIVAGIIHGYTLRQRHKTRERQPFPKQERPE